MQLCFHIAGCCSAEYYSKCDNAECCFVELIHNRSRHERDWIFDLSLPVKMNRTGFSNANSLILSCPIKNITVTIQVMVNTIQLLEWASSNLNQWYISSNLTTIV